MFNSITNAQHGVNRHHNAKPLVMRSTRIFFATNFHYEKHFTSAAPHFSYLVEEQIVGVADYCHSCPFEYPSDWWSNFILILLLASWHQFLRCLSWLAIHLPPRQFTAGKPYLYFFSVPFVSFSEPILGLFPGGDNWYLSSARSVANRLNLHFRQACRGSILDQENVESRTGHSIDAYALTRANILVTCCSLWLAYRFCIYCA